MKISYFPRKKRTTIQNLTTKSVLNDNGLACRFTKNLQRPYQRHVQATHAVFVRTDAEDVCFSKEYAMTNSFSQFLDTEVERPVALRNGEPDFAREAVTVPLVT